MSLHPYRNELIVALFVAVTIASFGFLQHQKQQAYHVRQDVVGQIEQIKEAAALRRIWKQKKMKQKLEKLRTIFSDSKVKKWEFGRKKLSVTLEKIDAKKLDKFLSKILSLPVQIQSMHVAKEQGFFRLECECKWQ